MKYDHSKICNAPICSGDKNPNYKVEVIWYAGEEVCTKAPYLKFQRKQLDINKWVNKGKFKELDRPLNAHQLETLAI